MEGSLSESPGPWLTGLGCFLQFLILRSPISFAAGPLCGEDLQPQWETREISLAHGRVTGSGVQAGLTWKGRRQEMLASSSLPFPTISQLLVSPWL